MCGIVAVLHRPEGRSAPSISEVLDRLQLAEVALGDGRLDGAADQLDETNRLLGGVAGLRCLASEVGASDAVRDAVRRLVPLVQQAEAAASTGADLEARHATIVRLKDALWAIEHDRLRHHREVVALAGDAAGVATLRAYSAIQTALSSIDRLEVRGRDSAGLHVIVTGHSVAGDALCFVYKAAAEIGELGDNVRRIRGQIVADELLRRALSAESAEVIVLGHTRWASVGLISEANAHPLDDEEVEAPRGPYVCAALNGDVDNHVELRKSERLVFHDEVTTDAKIIPALISRRMAKGDDLAAAFCSTVARFEGSVAIGACAADEPDRVVLALRGSGQALYVGLAEECFVAASEPYGLVEETSEYLRLDGETPGPHGVAGQIVALDRSGAGTLAGVTRLSYDGTALPISEDEIAHAAITTRDIDRAGFPHYLIKEISQSPDSVRKTLVGRIVTDSSGRLEVGLGHDVLPEALRRGLADGRVHKVVTIGQGTAAIAAESVAMSIQAATAGALQVSSMPASELSGFDLADDMSDTLVVPISQSGTTTDTNRTVDLVRARGASVVSIVNRRNSDLVDRSDGVQYTSDGRDVEMAVPSTKAFYMQVAAGFLLGEAIAQILGVGDRTRRHELLEALQALPDAMDGVLARRDQAAEAANRIALSRRYWSVVGNGRNAIAAREVRIKLSELCYKTIPVDPPEDRKHLDLSAEPLVLVCAAGLDGAVADDLAKELAIFRAHKAAPVLIVTEGDGRFDGAIATITVPPAHPDLAFVLSAMAGHLFGYEAALAIDAQAGLLREARAAIEEAVAADGDDPESLIEGLRPVLARVSQRFFEGLRSGAYNGNLEADTAVRLSSLLRYAAGLVPLDAFELEYGKLASPTVVVDDLAAALTTAIDDLTRTIDTIKHQAKTVTVGISRSEEALLSIPLVAAALAAGAAREQIGYRALRTLAALDPAVAAVTGYTRYRIDGALDRANISIVDRGGLSATIPSRTETDPRLQGTKHRAADEREVTVARGRRDGRTIVLVPEFKDGEPTGLTLLHVELHHHLDPHAAAGVLRGYRSRYAAIVDAVTETDPFSDELLGDLPLVDLLTDPVLVLAERWRATRA